MYRAFRWMWKKNEDANYMKSEPGSQSLFSNKYHYRKSR